MKPLLFVLFLFFYFPTKSSVQADIVEDLVVHFKNGNTKEIAKHFASSVELLIIDEEDVYSKAQAEQILKDFFVKNPPSKSVIVHAINSNPRYRYGIISLQTKSAKFRVNITLMLHKTSNTFLITELRIEKD